MAIGNAYWHAGITIAASVLLFYLVVFALWWHLSVARTTIVGSHSYLEKSLVYRPWMISVFWLCEPGVRAMAFLHGYSDAQTEFHEDLYTRLLIREL